MRRLVWLCALVSTLVLLISATTVHAQNLWVASYGSDANTCSQSSPCATFQTAIDKFASQINCLNSGNYGPFIVTRSIIVDCGTGNVGTVFTSGSTSAILLNIASSATVILRHLSLNGQNGGGANGIGTQTFQGGTLIVEDCVIQGYLGGYGIRFAPSVFRGLLQVSNSQITGSISGIYVQPLNGMIASVALNRVELVANTSHGVYLTGPGVVAGTLRDSVVAGNGITGVYADASQVYFTVEGSSIVANLGNGIETNSAGSVVNVGATTIGGNGTGVKATLGQLISFGNNQFSANGSDGTFTSTKALK